MFVETVIDMDARALRVRRTRTSTCIASGRIKKNKTLEVRRPSTALARSLPVRPVAENASVCAPEAVIDGLLLIRHRPQIHLGLGRAAAPHDQGIPKGQAS